MMNEERDLTTDSAAPESSEDDLRFAPPEAVEAPADSASDETDAPTVSDPLDIEAALAAVSNLSDMLAQQEAEEQARLAQEEAERQAAAERQARLEHPEQFFPVPPLSTLHRGQMASVVPALLLMAVGAWLTFSLTTAQTALNPALLAAVAVGAASLALLARWLTSGRWTRGALFFALTGLFGAGVFVYLLQPTSPGLAGGWPLLVAAAGLAFALTGLLAFPRERRLIAPGLALIAAGVAGLVSTLNLFGAEWLEVVGSLWPVAVGMVVALWLLPLAFRRRRS